MKRRLFALGLAATLSLSLLSGCGTKPSTPSDTGSSGNDSAGGKVYYLNFKPEQNAQWQELADLPHAPFCAVWLRLPWLSELPTP